ncbi:MAG: PQQ-dependent sugar dehydrogenase, partial [Chloroflexota bacterium]
GDSVRSEPFLDITEQVESGGSEQGLLGLAFHPEYEENGYFYITYSPSVDEWRMERYSVSDDPNRADPDSAETILSVDHPGDTHYAGMVTFGPDGYLWVSIGDGGAGAYDPLNDAQDTSSLHGSILRIDVDNGDPYAIPPDNPFVNDPNARPEIWAYGLRNPWRFSFDRETGDLYIGDVGQFTWEEVNVEPAGSEGGHNYGWPYLEGKQCSERYPDCDPAAYTPPIFDYDRSGGCAVTGGYVYRENPASPIYGTYVFADFCNGSIWTATEEESGEWDAGIRQMTPMNISSLGEDSAGRLYIVDFAGGEIHRVTAGEGAPAPVVHRLEPATISSGGVTCTLEVRGWNFDSSSSVFLGETRLSTEFVNDSRLRAELDPADMTTPGAFDVTVQNDESLISEPVAFEIEDSGAVGHALFDRWAQTDEPVASGDVARTWIWGPHGMTCPLVEPYEGAPDDQRVVQYFDKSRMEINDPAGDPEDPWYITNGLLATELITGKLQLGDTSFEEFEPSEENVAGDIDDATGPTYATFTNLTGAAEDRSGEFITDRIHRDGEIEDDPALDGTIQITAYDDVTGHNIAEPFWEFIHSSGPILEDGALIEGGLFPSPYFATGRPITEPYWAQVKLAEEQTEVLVQCFERRCLTYTPSNAEGWQVEAGNIGLHYMRWKSSLEE